MPGPLALLLLLLAVAPRSLPAQWQGTLVASAASSSGHARAETDPLHPEVAPEQQRFLELSLRRPLGGWLLGASVARASADLAVRDDDAAVLTRGALAAWGLGLEGGRRLLAGEGRTTVLLLAGGVVERWSFPVTGGEPRWLLNGRLATELHFPLRGAWRGVVRGELSAGGSLFGVGDLPPDYAVRGPWRRGLGIGVARGGT